MCTSLSIATPSGSSVSRHRLYGDEMIIVGETAASREASSAACLRPEFVSGRSRSSPSNSLREPALAWRTMYKGTGAP